MPTRPSWEGVLAFNLISIPVKAYNATAQRAGKIGFHLLHAKCHQRIRYKKVCPVHGEVGNEEIVSGYEYTKGQYVTVAAGERKDLKEPDDRTIAIDSFVSPEAIDPIYFSGRTFYLVPTGAGAQRPYSVLLAAMKSDRRHAVARVVMSGRGQVAIVRPLGLILCMTLLSFEDEIKSPESFEAELGRREVSVEERKLAEALVESATNPEFELARFKDDYTARMTKLIESKTRKKTSGRKPKGNAEPVRDLMDALKKSLSLERERTSRRARPVATARGTARRSRPRARV